MKNDLHHFIAMKNGTKTYEAPDGAAIHKMTEKQLCETFAATTAISHGAFRVLGKLRHELEIKKGKDGIYAALAAYGIDSDDVSNAGPACATYRELVIAGHVKEADYDGFTFGLCRAVTRVLGLSEKSPTKEKLTPDAVADIIKKFKKAAQKNLECVSANGVLLAEYEKAQELAAAEAKQAEAAAKKAGKTGTTAPAAETEDDEDEDEPEIDENVGTMTSSGSPAASPDTPAGDRVTHEVTTPPKAKASGFDRCNELLGELEDTVLEITPAEAAKLYERLAKLTQVICEYAATAEEDPAPAAIAAEIVTVANPRAGKNGKNGKVVLSA